MITSFEVGATFRLVNAASPELVKILRQVRELTASIDKAKESLASIGRVPGVSVAIGETDKLAASWDGVAASAKAARVSIGQATAASARAALPPTAVGGGGGGRRGFMQRLGGGGFGGYGGHGGGHMRFGGAGLATGGALAWGIDQAAKTEDMVFRMEDTAGVPHDETQHAKFRKLLQNFQVKYGYGIDAAGDAALGALRQFQGVPGGGVDVLDEILSAGSVEARRKGTGLGEAVEAGIGLAHQFKVYDAPGIKNLMQTFAALSTADPRTLSAMKRASGYAGPALAAIGFDQTSTLIAGTALARAGIDSTKSGTWIREMGVRAMPGVVLGHSASNKKHEEALKAFGLVDKDGKPTWFTDGRPDQFKLIGMTSDALQGMSVVDRAGYGRAAFGAQGFGAIATLGDPAVNAQMHTLRDTINSKAYQDRYNSFNADYLAGSTVQDARTTLAEFNVTMGEIGRQTLPTVNHLLTDFKGVLEGIRGALPSGSPGWSNGAIGARTAEGALIGAGVGAFGGGIGAVPGALVGGGTGLVYGVAEQYMANHQADMAKQEAEARERAKAQTDLFGGLSRAAGTLYGPKALPVVLHSTTNLNIDGRALASAVSEHMTAQSQYTTDTPASNGTSYDGP